MIKVIILFAALFLVIIYGLIRLSQRLRHENELNSAIYKQEQENRLESLNQSDNLDCLYVFNVETEKEALINWKEPEGEDTELTYKDLKDIDEALESGHMIF